MGIRPSWYNTMQNAGLGWDAINKVIYFCIYAWHAHAQEAEVCGSV